MRAQIISNQDSNMNGAQLRVVSHNYQISDKEFHLFQKLIYDLAEIDLPLSKRALVVGRLSKRMRKLNITSFEEYYKLVTHKNNPAELQNTIDYLTTNETYFFREEKHFDFIANDILEKNSSNRNFKIWSAASSSGEEAYSAAMVLADKLGLHSNWKIIGTDINQKVVSQAQRGQYPIAERDKIPKEYLIDYCLKGVRSESGTMLIDNHLKKHIDFELLNLNADFPEQISNFDVVFLRNVMIYFNLETKQRLVDKIADRIKLGGYMFIGHSETLNLVSDRFKIVRPSICMKIK